MRTVPWIMQVKFEICIFNHVEAIGIYPPKYRGHMSLTMPPFWKIFNGSCFGLSLGTFLYNIYTSINFTKLHYVQMK